MKNYNKPSLNEGFIEFKVTTGVDDELEKIKILMPYIRGLYPEAFGLWWTMEERKKYGRLRRVGEL